MTTPVVVKASERRKAADSLNNIERSSREINLVQTVDEARRNSDFLIQIGFSGIETEDISIRCVLDEDSQYEKVIEKTVKISDEEPTLFRNVNKHWVEKELEAIEKVWAL